jgi:hypothetical protein
LGKFFFRWIIPFRIFDIFFWASFLTLLWSISFCSTHRQSLTSYKCVDWEKSSGVLQTIKTYLFALLYDSKSLFCEEKRRKLNKNWCRIFEVNKLLWEMCLSLCSIKSLLLLSYDNSLICFYCVNSRVHSISCFESQRR